MPTHLNHNHPSPTYPVLPYQQRPPVHADDTPATTTQDRPPTPDCAHSITIQHTYMWPHHSPLPYTGPQLLWLKQKLYHLPELYSPTQVQSPSLIRGHLGHQKSSPQLRWRPHYSITSLYSLKTKEETEMKDWRCTYNHTKPRYLHTSVRTQSTTAKAICCQQNPVILLHKSLNIPTQMKYKKTSFKPTL